MRHGLTLEAQPPGLNILPLYIILLGLFPLIYGLIRIRPDCRAAGLRRTLWICVNLDPSINLTQWPNGGGCVPSSIRSPGSSSFVIGALGAQLLRRYGGNLPRPLWPARCSLGISRLPR